MFFLSFHVFLDMLHSVGVSFRFVICVLVAFQKMFLQVASLLVAVVLTSFAHCFVQKHCKHVSVFSLCTILILQTNRGLRVFSSCRVVFQTSCVFTFVLFVFHALYMFMF